MKMIPVTFPDYLKPDLHAKRNWLLVAFLNLVIVAFLGLLLRWMFVGAIKEINYKFLLHAHSHVALLGWLYTAVFVALLVTFLPQESRNQKTYTWQFWLSQGAVLGMLFSFPVQGYAAVSITFSTAHMLLSYWFIYQFLRDAGKAKINMGEHRLSLKFVKAALFFLAISSLGPWVMGPIMALGHIGSEMYFNAIYFYLHFQYNGWFTFSVLGLLFWLLEYYQVSFNSKLAVLFFRLMFWSCIPAYLLSVLWTKPDANIYLVSGVAAFVQVVALIILLVMLVPLHRQILILFGRWSRRLFILAAVAFLFKTGMQFASAFPYMAELAFRLRLFIIGYLHLVLIGFISIFLFAFFTQQGWLSFKHGISRWGMGLFLLGFISSESMLFVQGLLFWLMAGAIPFYNNFLFGVSILLPVGILLFFLGQLSGSRNNEAKVRDEIRLQRECAEKKCVKV
ncbi:hypothetical protein ACFSRY_01405 [Pontibacter locisalis]|uniref:Uncharacterized protein n=1 Tax=Pontibacter locisalis TaxID=1719035 RepID=A0ABW5IHW4_9BACT